MKSNASFALGISKRTRQSAIATLTKPESVHMRVMNMEYPLYSLVFVHLCASADPQFDRSGRNFSGYGGCVLGPGELLARERKRLVYRQLAECPNNEVLVVGQPTILNFRTCVRVFMQEQRQSLEDERPNLCGLSSVFYLRGSFEFILDKRG